MGPCEICNNFMKKNLLEMVTVLVDNSEKRVKTWPHLFSNKYNCCLLTTNLLEQVFQLYSQKKSKVNKQLTIIHLGVPMIYVPGQITSVRTSIWTMWTNKRLFSCM